MTELRRIEELEAEIASLKSYIYQVKPVKPETILQRIRQEYRDKYLATWDAVWHDETTVGPNGKNYSDYSTWMEIIRKETDMLFKYSFGKPNRGNAIASMATTDESIKLYREICEEVCRNLRDKIDRYTLNEGREEKH